jgi:hypothetical protein
VVFTTKTFCQLCAMWDEVGVWSLTTWWCCESSSMTLNFAFSGQFCKRHSFSKLAQFNDNVTYSYNTSSSRSKCYIIYLWVLPKSDHNHKGLKNKLGKLGSEQEAQGPGAQLTRTCKYWNRAETWYWNTSTCKLPYAWPLLQHFK